MAYRRPPPKQDLTGHVTLDFSSMKFIEEVNYKTHKVAVMRKNGLLPDKRERNPMMAEKSARPDHSGFDFFPPPKEPEPERWKYPDSDWGLMAKFRSQKPIYDDIFRREKEYNTRMAELHRIREKNQLKFDKELERQQRMLAKDRDARERAEKARMDMAMSNAEISMNMGDGGSARHHHHHHHHGHHHGDDTGDELDQSLAADKLEAERRARERAKKRTESHLMDSIHGVADGMPTHRKPPNDISEMKISEIRDLNGRGEKADVLRKWRAQRAAEFISTRKHALEVAPPRGDTLHRTAFKPGGVSTLNADAAAAVAAARRKQRGGGDSDGNSYAHKLLAAGADTVREELQRTEKEIARTELRLKLNKKPPRSFNKTS